MRRLFLILIVLLFSFTINAQYEPVRKRYIPEPVKVIGIYAGSIILDAIGDGFCDDGYKVRGHFCQAVSTALLVVSPFILSVDKTRWYWYVASYLTLRIALFDPVYNTTRGLPLDYIGSTSIWDKSLQCFNPPRSAMLWGHSVFFVIGISIPIKQLK